MKYKIVGYGSIMSHKSLRETVPDKRFEPVIVKGYKRIFDIKYYKGDVLNIEKARGHEFNAVLFSIIGKELAELKKRESGYDLEQCKVYDFKTGKKLGKSYLFIDHLVAIDHHKKNQPLKTYFKICREAAYHISEAFGKEWDRTTYTLDNERIASWIKKNKSYDSL